MLLVLVVGWLEGKCNNFYISTVLRDQWLSGSAVKRSVPQPVFTITERAPTRAFSWLKAPTSAFTFKTLLRHYAKRALNTQ